MKKPQYCYALRNGLSFVGMTTFAAIYVAVYSFDPEMDTAVGKRNSLTPMGGLDHVKPPR